MYAERETKIKTYDLRDYILRKSKNKDYHSFVLEAINSNPPEKSMTVHIGFQTPEKLNTWFQSIKFSVDFRQWELYLYLFKSKASTITQESPVEQKRHNTLSELDYTQPDPMSQSLTVFKTAKEDSIIRNQTQSVVRKVESSISSQDEPPEVPVSAT